MSNTRLTIAIISAVLAQILAFVCILIVFASNGYPAFWVISGAVLDTASFVMVADIIYETKDNLTEYWEEDEE